MMALAAGDSMRIALEHCCWAMHAGFSPAEVMSAIGEHYPQAQWHDVVWHLARAHERLMSSHRFRAHSRPPRPMTRREKEACGMNYSKVSAEMRRGAVAMLKEGKKYTEIGVAVGLSRTTVGRIAAELAGNQGCCEVCGDPVNYLFRLTCSQECHDILAQRRRKLGEASACKPRTLADWPAETNFSAHNIAAERPLVTRISRELHAGCSLTGNAAERCAG